MYECQIPKDGSFVCRASGFIFAHSDNYLCAECKSHWVDGIAPKEGEAPKPMADFLASVSGKPFSVEQSKSISLRNSTCLHIGPVFDRLDCNCPRKWKRRCDLLGETTLENCTMCEKYFADDSAVDGEPTQRAGKRTLIRFPHGFGDTVQLTTVLEHLRRFSPQVGEIHVETKIGCHSALKGYVDRFYLTDRNQRAPAGEYEIDLFLPWYEPDASYEGIPSTKAEKCLREQLGIQPVADLCRYKIEIGKDARSAAVKYLHEIGALRSGDRFRVVILHYFGNTSTWNKDLSHETARAVCDAALVLGFTLIVLDWEKRCPFVDQKTVFCPGVEHEIWQQIGTGDAERIAALIEASSLYIGIDSGPDHVAGSCTTPAIITWRGHHPLHYFGLADNVTHLVPENHADLIRGDRAVGLKSFESLYRYRTYNDITNGIVKAMRELLPSPSGPLVQHNGYWIRTDNIAQDMVIVNDIDRDDSYVLRKLLKDREPCRELVVDVGAHIGVFASVYHRLNPLAEIVCIEACPENLEALRRNVGDFATIIHGACTYEDGDVGLLNAVYSDCRSTGGSTVVSRQRLTEGAKEGEYWHDVRPLPKVTLEDAMMRTDMDSIALVKLDCEGSEFSILGKSPAVHEGKVRSVLGEFHGVDKWRALIADKFTAWEHDYRNTGNGLGNFWLVHQ